MNSGFEDLSNPVFEETLSSGFPFEMVLVRGGSFQMGNEDEAAFSSERPIHEVTVSDFAIGKYLVTQALWKAVMGEGGNPSYFKGDRRPVESISWLEAQNFIKKLNQQTEGGYRLPTEAEWEYAARGGRESQNYKYAGGNKLKEVGWFRDNSHGETKTVGLKDPNELGLYDMSGNVYEWVEDQWHDNYEGAPSDGSAWVDQSKGADRVLRGGGWDFNPRFCRVSDRFNGGPEFRDFDVGFRLVLVRQFSP